MSATDTNVAHSSLAEALAAFQGEDGLTFPKTKTARVKSQRTGAEYTYKYADLGDILPVVRPLLSRHGLSWRAKPILAESGDMHLWYRLEHVSGETDTGQIPMGVKADCKPQDLGSAITYARRYALTAQLNLATEEDDDAQAAQGAGSAQAASNGSQNGGHFAPQSPQSPQSPQPSAAAPRPSERQASAKQRSMIEARARAAGLTAGELANIIRTAAGEERRDWQSDEHATQTLGRLLDRLPARLVDGVLEEIAHVLGLLEGTANGGTER